MGIAKIINSVNIVHIRLKLAHNFNFQKFEYATEKLSKVYNTHIYFTQRTTPFATEICYHIENDTLHMFMNHKYYDGKILSILARQLDELYQNSEYVIKKEFHLQVQPKLPFELGLQLYNKHLSKHTRNGKKIQDFYEPLSITSVINYIKDCENKNIVMLRVNKTTTKSDGENYTLMVIRKHQDFKYAMANPEEFNVKKLPLLVPFVFANFYTKFHRPSFCNEITIDTNLLSITSVVQLLKGEIYTLYPKTSSGNYPLYIG